MELNKKEVIDKNIHEIKNEIIRDYAGEFEIVGRMKIADQTRETHFRFSNTDNYEAYDIPIDQDYEFEDAVFIGYLYKIKTLQFNLVNRSQNGNCCDFKHEIVEYRGDNCFIPTKRYCFVK